MTESVKLDVKVVNLVRKNKERTHVPIAKFIEQAIINELKRQKK